MQPNSNYHNLVNERYRASRNNLLLMIILTLVNLVMLYAGSNRMLLFSATVPYLSVVFGMAMMKQSLYIACVILALICLAIYFLCWLLSKHHYGWMIAAMVLFGLDTLVLLSFYAFAGISSGVFDLLIHVYVMYCLITGVVYGVKRQKLPEEPMDYDGSIYQNPVGSAEPLRRADTDGKFRVFLEAQAAGFMICYRRIERVNELVINGYVYGELKLFVEGKHELSAVLNGHRIQAGFDGRFSYICVDGELVTRKIRWF